VGLTERRLQDLSRRRKQLFGSRAMAVLLATLRRPDLDSEVVHLLLEILLVLVCSRPGDQPVDAAQANATRLLTDSATVGSIVSLLASGEVWIRTMALQLLTALYTAKPEVLCSALLRAERAMAKLLDALDDPRDEVRTEVLLLLSKITKGKPDIQSFVAFEDGYSRLLRVARTHAASLRSQHASWRAAPPPPHKFTVPTDCARIVANVLEGNATCRKLFVQSSAPLHLVLELVAVSNLLSVTQSRDPTPDSPDSTLVSVSLSVIERLCGVGEASSNASADHLVFEFVAAETMLWEVLSRLAFCARVCEELRCRALNVLTSVVKGAGSRAQVTAATTRVVGYLGHPAEPALLTAVSMTPDPSSTAVPKSLLTTAATMLSMEHPGDALGAAAWSLAVSVADAQGRGDDTGPLTLLGLALNPPPLPPSLHDSGEKVLSELNAMSLVPRSDELDSLPPIPALALAVSTMLFSGLDPPTDQSLPSTALSRSVLLFQLCVGASPACADMALRLGVNKRAVGATAKDAMHPRFVGHARGDHMAPLMGLLLDATARARRSEAVFPQLLEALGEWVSNSAAAAADAIRHGLLDMLLEPELDGRGPSMLSIAVVASRRAGPASSATCFQRIMDQYGLSQADSLLSLGRQECSDRLNAQIESARGWLREEAIRLATVDASSHQPPPPWDEKWKILIDILAMERLTPSESASMATGEEASRVSFNGKQLTVGEAEVALSRLSREQEEAASTARLLRKSLAEAESGRRSAEEELSATRAMEGGDSSTLVELKMAYDSMKKQFAAAHMASDQAKRSLEQLQAESAKAEERFEGQLSERDKSVTELRKDLTKHENTIAQLRADLNAALAVDEDEMAALQKQLGASRATVSTLEEEVRALKSAPQEALVSRIGVLEGSLREEQQRSKEAETLRARVKELEERSRDVESRRESELVQSEEHRRELERQLAAMEQERTALARKEVEARGASEALRAQLEALQRRAAQMERELLSAASHQPVVEGDAFEQLKSEHEDLLVLLAAQEMEVAAAYHALKERCGVDAVLDVRRRVAEELGDSGVEAPGEVLAELSVVEDDAQVSVLPVEDEEVPLVDEDEQDGGPDSREERKTHSVGSSPSGQNAMTENSLFPPLHHPPMREELSDDEVEIPLLESPSTSPTQPTGVNSKSQGGGILSVLFGGDNQTPEGTAHRPLEPAEYFEDDEEWTEEPATSSSLLQAVGQYAGLAASFIAGNDAPARGSEMTTVATKPLFSGSHSSSSTEPPPTKPLFSGSHSSSSTEPPPTKPLFSGSHSSSQAPVKQVDAPMLPPSDIPMFQPPADRPRRGKPSFANRFVSTLPGHQPTPSAPDQGLPMQEPPAGGVAHLIASTVTALEPHVHSRTREHEAHPTDSLGHNALIHPPRQASDFFSAPEDPPKGVMDLVFGRQEHVPSSHPPIEQHPEALGLFTQAADEATQPIDLGHLDPHHAELPNGETPGGTVLDLMADSIEDLQEGSAQPMQVLTAPVHVTPATIAPPDNAAELFASSAAAVFASDGSPGDSDHDEARMEDWWS
jgi:hypothetical protein